MRQVRCEEYMSAAEATLPASAVAGRRVQSGADSAIHHQGRLIEDKANGSAVIQMLAHEIPGLLPVNPSGGKVARAQAISTLVEAGNIYLPHPDYAPWVNDFREECVEFPNGAHDDQVDAMTQAILRWNGPKGTVIQTEKADVTKCHKMSGF